MKYSILVIYYNKYGINDGEVYQVVNERFETISNHKSQKLAERKVNFLIKENTLIEANKKRGVNPHIKTELKGGLNK